MNIARKRHEGKGDKFGCAELELTCFDDLAAALDVQVRDDERDICEIEDLSPMRQRHRPEFGRWP